MAIETTWKPRSVYAEAGDLVWLPRLLDKARRALEGEKAGKELLWPYMYGDSDYMDARLLRFLGVTGDEVLDILRQARTDDAAVAAILARAGKSQQERQAWSRSFRRREAPFLILIEADDGRLAGGPAAALLGWLYNTLILPIGVRMYHQGEARRRQPASNGHGPHAASRAGYVAVGMGIGLLVAAAYLVWREDLG